jgi:hypothetical protein
MRCFLQLSSLRTLFLLVVMSLSACRTASRREGSATLMSEKNLGIPDMTCEEGWKEYGKSTRFEYSAAKGAFLETDSTKREPATDCRKVSGPYDFTKVVCKTKKYTVTVTTNSEHRWTARVTDSWDFDITIQCRTDDWE